MGNIRCPPQKSGDKDMNKTEHKIIRIYGECGMRQTRTGFIDLPSSFMVNVNKPKKLLGREYSSGKGCDACNYHVAVCRKVSILEISGRLLKEVTI